MTRDSTDDRLALLQGPSQPHTGTPARRPGSVRRTTTHTALRPDGLTGPVHVVARGRDLWTGRDGDTGVLAQAAIDADVAFVKDRALTALRSDPPWPGAEDLIGTRVGGGFRQALDQLLPEGQRAASLAYQLLDDLPTAVLVSGVVLANAGLFPPADMLQLEKRADICAGWASGATILVEAERIGRVPNVRGPDAPSLDCTGDPDAWHGTEPMPPHTTRRSRRIDVWPNGGPLAVEAFFRDSYADDQGIETVVHEYLVTAEVDPESYLFRSCEPEIGVLPWMECPSAAASARRLVGTPSADLRTRIRDSFVGVTTCTHLNDTLRALGALPFLAGLVHAGGPPT